uniref:Protein phosphatase 1 regulatory subunit 15B n=1 Tax=Astyanax mexicanus TaxID=7994 RepID=A0A3B1JIX4_ASTMX
MFKSMNSEEHFSNMGSQPSSTSLEKANVANVRSESSWVSMLSTVSRPAWTLLQKYLPGRAQTPSLESWAGEAERSKMDMKNPLRSLMPESPRRAHLSVAYVHCQHDSAAFVTSGDSGEALSWLTADSLAELGIENAARFEAQHAAPPAGYLNTARNFLGQVLLNAATTQKEATSSEHQPDVWYGEPAAIRYTTGSWWDGLWGASDNPQTKVPNSSPSSSSSSSSRNRTSTDTKWTHCAEHSRGHCQAAECGSAVVTDMVDSMPRESAGPSHLKEPANNEALHMPRPESLPSSEQLPSLHQHSGVGHLVCTRAVAACSEVAVLTPDQDNGYSSLEEENANSKQLIMRLGGEKQEAERLAASQGSTGSDTGCEGEGGEGSEAGQAGESIENPQSEEVEGQEEKEKEEQEEEASEPMPVAEASSHLSTPSCQNKAIAYIMGSPCSDESGSEDDSDWDGSNDDDGFDSEGSSQFSDSEDLEDSDDEDEDQEDSEADEFDSESERLWNSLCQNRDPYNPRNFTAPIQTTPRANNSDAVESPVSGSPVESEDPFSAPSPLVPQEEESSDDTCSTDEAENLRLWNSFSCSADPYNPLNFQAPTRTQEKARGRCKKGTSLGTPVYKKEEAEERLDSGFSETAPLQDLGSSRCVRLKKVTFVEEVEEFYASSDEDRHGPWEEFARDRCRFQRRVQEVEETISYCLAPTFRLVIFERLYHSS